LRRRDQRTGWLIAVGSAFAVTALVGSTARGIFHPYYVSLLAPFCAALVGAAVGLALEDRQLARRLGAVALAGGAVTEIVVVHTSATDLAWMTPVLIGGAGIALTVLGLTRSAGVRAVAVAGVVAVLLAA
jgi:4-amino-4-deoxy-L-arabinose transferase-like glycosyltransferase